jgi:hypothetical protein
VDHTEDSCGDGRRLDGCGKILIRWRGPADCEDRYRAVHDRLRRPIVTTDVAVKDVGSAIDFILQRRGISRINLMG